ncbi:MAG: type II toxin-antitoxin system HicB family antitoxin [Acidobacteria bacterium]|nr:type II toxin-antitoxin system HicB family antitoxin [Acidobacteriota bacterium]MBV9068252.1 type II toxin-antitoxin system HicB family antitoxin [Acidobacteriota bacterium]MBV9185066.1 type II toxin-antitoxin system HicB family antitoxin [Acidobacteriota bacterium]
MDYEVIIEEGHASFGAYVPELPGCVAVGESQDEAMQLIRQAIEIHIESLVETRRACHLRERATERRR